MSSRDEMSLTPPERGHHEVTLERYVLALAVVMMLLGLRQWAIILGVIPGSGGMFEAMSTPWKLATMDLAVVDLVASVGLWLRVAWGKVIWIFALVSEIAFHTVFIRTFGGDLLIVAFHLVTFAVFVVLTIMARRPPEE
jgi:hypothetical protein